LVRRTKKESAQKNILYENQKIGTEKVIIQNSPKTHWGGGLNEGEL